MKRLAATALMSNHPRGYVVLTFADYEVNDFGLYPLVNDEALFLPDPEAPGYRVAITATNPDVLDRVGRALQALARKQRDGQG